MLCVALRHWICATGIDWRKTFPYKGEAVPTGDTPVKPFVDLKDAPATGLEVAYKGQVYTCAAVRDYVRKRDGVPSHLLDWMSECVDCGTPFIQTTGLVLQWPVRRCPGCRKGSVFS